MSQPITESVTAHIDQRLHHRLSRLAQERRRSEGDILREALEAYLGASRPDSSGASCYDLALQSRVIGAGGDLPSDLSTDPSHFEGFGQ